MNHYEEILKITELTVSLYDNWKKSSEVLIFKSLVEIMGSESFNSEFDTHFHVDMPFETCFYNFHKSMRQTDFFGDNYFRKDVVNGKVLSPTVSDFINWRGNRGKHKTMRKFTVGYKTYYCISRPDHLCSLTFDEVIELPRMKEVKDYDIIISILRPNIRKQSDTRKK